MNKREESKSKMYDTTEKLCNDNSTLVATNEAFNDALTELSAKIKDINAAAAEQAKVLKGLTDAKNDLKKTLSLAANEIAGFVYAYASKVQNLDLKAQTKVTLSGLLELRDKQVKPKCTSIVNAATDNLPALAPYSVTAGSIAALQAIMDNYEEALPANGKAKSVRTSFSDKIKQLITDADEILNDRMDNLVKKFADTNADFVAAYNEARKIVDPSYNKKAIKKALEVKKAA